MAKLPTTPRSRVKNTLRMLWLHSRERAEALKRDNHTCKDCGKKAYRKTKDRKVIEEQKVQVHHKKGIGNWEKVIDLIFEEILCDPKHLETVCPECHDKKEIKRKKK